MTFKPYPVLTLCSVAVLGVLLWLGCWQAGRAGWKADLIDAYKARANVAAVSLDAALCAPADSQVAGNGIPTQAVKVPEPSDAKRIRLYGHSSDGRPGWRWFAQTPAPACLPGQVMLVEVAFEKLAGDSVEPIHRQRLEAWPEKSAFVAKNDPGRNEWYWFEADAIAAALEGEAGAVLNRDMVIVSDMTIPNHLVTTPPERHIGYSVTWFGMAIALIVLYGAFHMRAGRLRFGG